MTHLTKRFVLHFGIAFIAVFLSTQSANAIILEDFQFNDVNGTTLSGAVNSANPGNNWSEDADMSNSSVFDGSYRIQKDNDNFGTNFLQITNITSSKAWWVVEFDGWSFSDVVGSPDFDSTQLEEVRFSFLEEDTGTSGNSNFAQVRMQRAFDTGEILLFGEESGAGTSISGSQLLNTVQTDPFTLVLEIDQDTDQYSILYRQNADPFQSLGTADLDPDRDGNSIRFVANNNFSGAGEFVDIDRLYLTDESPLTEFDTLKLRVNTVTGLTEIINESGTFFDIDSYRIESSTDDLNFAGWNSLSTQGVDDIGGGIGESWDEAGGSDDGVLAESFLLGNSLFDTSRAESLGYAFKVGGDTESLSFQYRRASDGAVFDGEFEFVTTGGLPGDYNGDGSVDAADYTVWRDNEGANITLPNENPAATTPGVVDQEDYNYWVSQYGSSSSNGFSTSVPEPATGSLLVLALCGGLYVKRGRKYPSI